MTKVQSRELRGRQQPPLCARVTEGQESLRRQPPYIREVQHQGSLIHHHVSQQDNLARITALSEMTGHLKRYIYGAATSVEELPKPPIPADDNWLGWARFTSRPILKDVTNAEKMDRKTTKAMRIAQVALPMPSTTADAQSLHATICYKYSLATAPVPYPSPSGTQQRSIKPATQRWIRNYRVHGYRHYKRKRHNHVLHRVCRRPNKDRALG